MDEKQKEMMSFEKKNTFPEVKFTLWVADLLKKKISNTAFNLISR